MLVQTLLNFAQALAPVRLRWRGGDLTTTASPSVVRTAAAGGPILEQLGTGVMILAHNDLSNFPAPTDGVLLLTSPLSYNSATSVCSELGETLWSPTVNGSLAATVTSLTYATFAGHVPANQKFWVAGLASPSEVLAVCAAVDSAGEPSSLPCTTPILALCTHSASVSNVSFEDKSPRWQVTQRLNSSTGFSAVGYRDFFAFKFLGLRYAAKPIRFEHSTPYYGLSTTTGPDPALVQDALNFHADCPQPVHDFPGPFDEDCLFLALWTPYLPSPSQSSASSTSSTPSQRPLLPVMLYIYGGGLFSGSIANPNTDCTNLASRGEVVCIAIPHRLGNLGWLPFSGGSPPRGNYGLGDMVSALEWTRDHVAAFGGDPARVTVFGESGGASAVRALLASPRAAGRGLFHGAVMMSGPGGFEPYGSWSNYSTVDAAAAGVTAEVLRQTACKSPAGDVAAEIECLRGWDAQKLVELGANDPGMAALAANAHYPVIDHHLLLTAGLPGLNPSLPSQVSFASNISVVHGTNRDELAITLAQLPPPTTTSAAEYLSWVQSFLNTSYDYAPALSPSAHIFPATNSSADVFSVGSDVLTSAFFRCLDVALALSASRHRAFARTFRYEFNRTYAAREYTAPACEPPPGQSPERAEYHKCHGGEQVVVFGVMGRGGGSTDNNNNATTSSTPRPKYPERDGGRDLAFSRWVLDTWAAFARDPFGAGPNGDIDWLRARGPAYASTLERVATTGRWRSVEEGTAEEADRVVGRLWQWEATEVDFLAHGGGTAVSAGPRQPDKLCDALGLGSQWFETAM